MAGLSYRNKEGDIEGHPSTGTPAKTICELDPGAGGGILLYSFADQSAPERNPMEDADLDRLTAKIDQLIRLNERLRAENRQLREERARLVEQNELARHTVESMISRLKALEQDS